jgi:glycosyltransferase involved in cell wall biosynthesis
VIGPSTGGPTGLVVDGVTGLQIDPLEVPVVADAIAEMFSDSKRLRIWGTAGHTRLLREFTFDRFVARFLGETSTLRQGQPNTRDLLR